VTLRVIRNAPTARNGNNGYVGFDIVRKKEIGVKSILLVSAVMLPLIAQEGRPFNQIMKEVGGSVGEVKKAFEGQGNKDAVASGAEKLGRLFKEVEVFFDKRGGAADAVEFAKISQSAAKELLGEATSGTKPGALAALAKVSGSCQGCHDAHREKLPEGGYTIK
jgi:cytochrome c556